MAVSIFLLMTLALATGMTSTAALRTALRYTSGAQRCDAAGGLFVVADGQDPLFRDVPTGIVDARSRRLALPGMPFTLLALLDELADVDGVILADDDVVAAGAESVTTLYEGQVLAGMAKDFQTANNSPTMQVAVVQPILVDDVAIKPVEVFVGEQLSGEETRPAQALQAAARRTGAARVGLTRIMSFPAVRICRT
jgi:hypothetical protein